MRGVKLAYTMLAGIGNAVHSVPIAVKVSTGKDAGHAGKHLKKIVQCSSGWRVGAELLADAN